MSDNGSEKPVNKLSTFEIDRDIAEISADIDFLVAHVLLEGDYYGAERLKEVELKLGIF